mmetsp:Transcript_37571/g.38263  ORF Transcript_37571/g.38263 Transcript_37571/m.38263 type:complete len:265 (+) Transcript_37571:128-922(+)
MEHTSEIEYSSQLKKGKWSTEEYDYARTIIYCFKVGYAPGCGTTTLRCYLANKINCSPMRVSKKFPKIQGLGLRMEPKDKLPQLIEKTIVNLKAELEQKRSAYLVKETEIKKSEGKKRKYNILPIDTLLSRELLSNNAHNKRRCIDMEWITKSDFSCEGYCSDNDGKDTKQTNDMSELNLLANFNCDNISLFDESSYKTTVREAKQDWEQLFIEDWAQEKPVNNILNPDMISILSSQDSSCDNEKFTTNMTESQISLCVMNTMQ